MSEAMKIWGGSSNRRSFDGTDSFAPWFGRPWYAFLGKYGSNCYFRDAWLFHEDFDYFCLQPLSNSRRLSVTERAAQKKKNKTTKVKSKKQISQKSQKICETRAVISKNLFRLWRPVIPGSHHSNSDKFQEKIIAEIKRRLVKKSHPKKVWKRKIKSFVKNLDKFVKPELEFQNYDE